jgi:CSLREA domain-containing protein
VKSGHFCYPFETKQNVAAKGQISLKGVTPGRITMLTGIRQNKMGRFILVLILITGALGVLRTRPVLAATLTVTNTNDSGPGSLRQAIADAGLGDVITFGPSLSGQTITLASTLVIDRDLTIDASSLPARISISGNNSVPVFEIASERTASLYSLIIANGNTTEWQMGGGILNFGVLHIINSTIRDNKGVEGGGIKNLGTLDIKNSQITNNSANIIGDSGAVGGGILNYGTLTVTDSVLDGNMSQGAGGGIYNEAGTIDIAGCMFSNNSAQGGGGGIGVISGSLKSTASTFSTNSAETGGAIYINVSGVLEVRDSVFSENSALAGGAIITFAENPVTITNGTFSVNSASSNGGAIIHQGYELNIVDSSFMSNSSGAAGGAVVNYSQSIMRISNTTFSKNSAEDGGAFYNGGKLTITGSSFLGNLATKSGGAGNFLVSGPSSITDSSFSNNSAHDGGGIFNYSSAPELTNVTFTGNSAENGSGGGLLNYAKSNPSLTNVVFSDNSALSGGGMSNTESSPSLKDVTFSDNSASSDGGGIFSVGASTPALNNVSFLKNSTASNGGGMYNFNTTPVLTNVTFMGNMAGLNGGGIYNDIDGNPLLNNVTLSGNSALSGGGMFNFTSIPTITNSILWGNTGGEIISNTSAPVVTSSIVQGGYTGTGNMNVDPKLASPANNGGLTQTMALLPGSPAINAGSDVNCPLTDQRGVGRLQGPHCDMGAYEYISATPVTWTVTKTADTNDGICDTDCSLREALTNSYGGDTIKFGVSGTIVLGSALPAINKSLVIDGSGQTITLDGAKSYRIFTELEAGDLTVKYLTFQNGQPATPCEWDINLPSCGGAIYTDGKLTVINSTFSGNAAVWGGAIVAVGYNKTVGIENSTFKDNSVVQNGGAIFNLLSVLNIKNSTFYGNTAGDWGGGILNDLGSLALNNNTFSNNSAAHGAGVYNSAGGLELANNILANSTSGDDCYNESPYAEISLNINNLIETNAAAPNNCGTPFLTADPMLGSLASNGGSTQTMALLTGSPAIDAGDDASCPAADQRGVTRPYGTHCDIGAYEKNSGTLPINPTFTDVPASHPYFADIEILYANGYTGGCSISPLTFCPDKTLDRAQASVFMMRGANGATYSPHPTTFKFKDNWSKVPYARSWAEAMRETGLTAGCQASPLQYCPMKQLTREEAIIFALKMKYGNNYQPPAATGTVFADMTNPNYWATRWAEKAYADGLIPACGQSNGKPKICPSTLVTRGLGAYMIVRAKNLTMP